MKTSNIKKTLNNISEFVNIVIELNLNKFILNCIYYVRSHGYLWTHHIIHLYMYCVDENAVPHLLL